jgi:hypothetical protein
MIVEANEISPSPTSHYATMSSSMILRHKIEGVIEDPELWLALKKLFVQTSLGQSTHNHASGCTFLDKLPRELRSEIYNASSNSFILLNLPSSTYILLFLHVDRYMKKLREFCMATTTFVIDCIGMGDEHYNELLAYPLTRYLSIWPSKTSDGFSTLRNVGGFNLVQRWKVVVCSYIQQSIQANYCSFSVVLSVGIRQRP